MHSLTPVSIYFTSSVLASPSSVPSTQRPRLHIQPGWDRRPVWPLWRPHSQPLTPEIVVRAGSILPNMLIYLNFLPRCPPHWQWRWKEVQGSWCDLMSIQGHLCTDTVSSRELSHSSSMYSIVKKCRREQNILLTAFPRKHCQNK